MRKLLIVFSLATLTACASTHDFTEGSKLIGSLLWHSVARTHTECTYVDGHGNVCYQVKNRPHGELTPEQAAEIEAHVKAQVAQEQAPVNHL